MEIVQNVRFSLQVPDSKAISYLHRLRAFALEMSGVQVSGIVSFYGDSCEVSHQEGLPDPLELMKMAAKGVVVHEPTQRLKAITPTRFSSFVVVLPNNRFLTLGVAKQPAIVEMSDGRVVETPWHSTHIWQTTAPSLAAPTENQGIPPVIPCKNAHKKFIQIMRQAKDIGFTVLVEDPIGLWDNELMKETQIERSVCEHLSGHTERVG